MNIKHFLKTASGKELFLCALGLWLLYKLLPIFVMNSAERNFNFLWELWTIWAEPIIGFAILGTLVGVYLALHYIANQLGLSERARSSIGWVLLAIGAVAIWQYLYQIEHGIFIWNFGQ